MDNSQNQLEEGINLLDFLNIIKKNFKSILMFTSIVTFLAVVYSLVATKYYSTYVSIYPMKDSNNVSSSLGNLEGLATSFGLNIGNSNQTSFYIPDIVDSRKIKKEIVSLNWKTDKFTTPVDLITLWEFNDTTGFSFMKFLNKIISPIDLQNPDLVYIESAIEELDERITVEEDDSGLITISVLMEEPQLASDIANFISQYIKMYISEEMTLQSTRYREFIEDRLEHSKSELSASEEDLTKFRKHHPSALDTPDLQMERARLIRDVKSIQEVYLTLLTQYEIAKIEELKETPVINILDRAEPPIENKIPNKLRIIFIGFFLSIITSSYYCYFNERINILKSISN